MDNLTLIKRAAGFIFLVLLAVLAYLNIPSFHFFITETLRSAEDPQELKEFVLFYGINAPLIIFFLTLLQAMITILPLLIVMIASSMVFGLFWGVVVMMISQVVAGYIAFLLARYFGRPFVERFVPPKRLEKVNKVIEKYGTWGVLVARLIPFGSFDLVNFASGLLSVRDRDFITGTLIGALPATVFYCTLGVAISQPLSFYSGYYVLIVFLLIFFGLLTYWYRRQNK